MRRLFHFQGFYSKMLFFCILLLSTTSLILSSIGSNLASQHERNEYLKKYDIALNDLHRIFSAKHKNYYNTIGPLFVSTSHYVDLCTLLKTDDPYKINNTVKKNIVDMLKSICDRDLNCVGILLYSSTSNLLYQYDKKFQTINAIPLQNPFPAQDPFVLNVLDDVTISSLSTSFYKPASRVYGMVGTLFEHFGKENSILGNIIVMYPASELFDSISEYHLDSEYIFSIVDSKNNTIFRSTGDYAATYDLITPPTNVHTSDIISYPVTVQNTDNISWYTASIYNGRYGYAVTYQIPKSGGQMSYTETLIIALALFTCLFSVGLYVLTFRIASKKVHIIQEGMSKIGNNNLVYRIPTPKGQDEFSQIITGFNRMCEELQQNVEKSYVYELQQKKAELYALQTSINPHFLYNTLELIRVQILQGNRNNAAQMLLLLSKIYRSQIHRNMYASIEEELDQCENLISLYQYRFENFEYDFHTPTSLYSFGLPKNTLQPLIENYFVHGLDPARDDNYLSLMGKMVEIDSTPCIRLTLSNNGQSITEAELGALQEKLKTSVFQNNEAKGFALSNVNSRLRIVFGENFGIFPDIGENGIGFKIDILIPPVFPDELNKSLRQLPSTRS